MYLIRRKPAGHDVSALVMKRSMTMINTLTLVLKLGIVVSATRTKRQTTCTIQYSITSQPVVSGHNSTDYSLAFISEWMHAEVQEIDNITHHAHTHLHIFQPAHSWCPMSLSYSFLEYSSVVRQLVCWQLGVDVDAQLFVQLTMDGWVICRVVCSRCVHRCRRSLSR